MRRPQSAFGLAAVIASLLVVSPFPEPTRAAVAPAPEAPARVYEASGRCTVWKSQYVPPKTIRVLRSKRAKTPAKVAGKVQEVDFRDYVATTMAVEWPEHYPAETLRAGAVATKQFAWYYILNWRGGTKRYGGKRHCYDVKDTWVDQYYYPEKYGVGKPNGPGNKIHKAIAETWDVSLRKYKAKTKSSRMFLTGYRAGSSTTCGADATGFKLFHHSTRACGEDGLEWREILRLYLKPNLEIVEPGRHDLIGTRHGDNTVMVRNASAQWVAHAWPKAKDRKGGGAPAGIKLASTDLVGYGSGDVNGDDRDDLIWLRKTGARSGKIKVALSTGSGYGSDLTWWEGDTIVPLSNAKLLVGDFHADDRTDVALLGRGDAAGKSRLVVFRRKPYGDSKKFAAPQQHWHGTNDHGRTAGAWAGDISGDGRADLIIRQNPPSGGVRLKTAVTKSPLLMNTNQRTNGLKVKWHDRGLNPAKTRMVSADANRDGREDMLLLHTANGRARLDRLAGQPKGGFKRTRLWSAPKGDPIPVKRTKLGTADVDYDGRADLVLYSKRSDGSTRVRVLRTRYDGVVDRRKWKEPSLTWKDLRPY